MSVRVLLAEDHTLVREGLLLLLGREPDLAVVAEASNGDETLERIKALKPDVAVVDIEMPGMTGIEVARKTREEGLETAVVLVSMHSSKQIVESALDAGASGYVLKDGAAREMIDAIRAAAAGNVYLSPQVTGLIVGSRRKGDRKPAADLTAREREVLRQLTRGLTSKEIAARLGITARTVEGHRASLMNKLGIRNVPGLVRYAILNHIVALEE